MTTPAFGLDLDVLRTAIQRDGRARALFVTGSHADGRADEHSDLDLLLVTGEDDVGLFAGDLPAILGGIERIVDATSRPLGPSVLVNLITERCRRVDVVVTTAQLVTENPRFGPVRTLFDPTALADALPPVSEPFSIAHDEAWFDTLIRTVLRTVSLLPMLLARDERLRAAQHVQLLKQDLLSLLLFAEGDPPVSRPGIWEWSELPTRLSAASLSLVEGLPPADPSVDGVIAGHLAVLDAFLDTARNVAAARDFPWTYDELSAAVDGHLERSGPAQPGN